MILGLQVLGCTREFRRDPEGFLDTMKAAGYTHIEPVVLLDETGFLAERLGGIAWSIDETAVFLKMMQERGLSLLSAHLFSVDVLNRLDEMKRLAEVGVKAFVFGVPKDGFEEFGRGLEKIAQELGKLGCECWLHNAEDVLKGEAGCSPFERVLAAAPHVKVQLDTGWALYDGRDMCAMAASPDTRLACLHFKDMTEDCASKQGIDRFAVLGEGVTDIKAVLKAAGDVPVFVDQDRTRLDFVDDLCRSAKAIHDAANPYSRDENSVLETYNIETGERTVLREFDCVIEAPNWSPNGKYLVYNSDGRMYRYTFATGEVELIDTGAAVQCNNDHVISADGTQLAVSHMTFPAGGMTSHVYILPVEGGEARKVTTNTPCFLHGWSPDGKVLAYCAFRDRDNGGDIYTISVAGGEETQLTDAPGLNDGPEFDPSGETIWFNSVRTGLMQAWRMKTDGSEQTQMTFDEDLNTWFPHVSPDGKRVVMISYHKGDLLPGEHLPGKNVLLRLMDADGKNMRTIVSLYGGQGTMNVNSWAPDSKAFAFVSYKPKNK